MSSEHFGHSLCSIADSLREKKARMLNGLEKRNMALLVWQGRLDAVTSITSGYTDGVDVLDEHLSLAANELDLEVEKILARSRCELKSLKSDDLELLQNQEDSLTHGVRNIQEEIGIIKGIMNSDDIAKVLEYSVEKDGELLLSELKRVPLPVFKRGLSSVEGLGEIFGRLSAGERKSVLQPEIHPTLENTMRVSRRNSVVSSAPKQMSLMSSPVEVRCLTAYDLARVTMACVGKKQAWVRSEGRTINLIDIDGTVLTAVSHSSVFMNDIVVTEKDNILFTDTDGARVLSLSKTGILTPVFHTLCKPQKICSLKNGNVLLSFSGSPSRVVQYDRAGKIKMELERIKVRTVTSLEENRVNDDLYVCCTKYLLAFKSNGKQRYHYPVTEAENVDTSFDLVCVRSDLMGHVIIADSGDNCSVHILDKDGEFLQYLMTKEEGLTRITVMDVDGEGHCWIRNCPREKSDEIRIVKYME